MHKSSLLAFLLVLFISTPAFAQFSAARKMNAPTEAVDEEFVDKDTGETKKRRVYKPAKKDNFGNAAGAKYDLAVDGAFEGQTVAVLHFYTGSGFDFAKPKAALKEKGFSVFRWINNPPPAKELREKLKKASQLWIIATHTRKLSNAHIKVIKDFFDSGKGVYIWGDNDPYSVDANLVAKALLGSGMSGDLHGCEVVEVDVKKKGVGLTMGHDITTGLEYLYEGHTVATLEKTKDLEPILYGSAGNLITAVYDKNGKRAVLDGAFTRLYWSWDEAGTGRYVKNVASWLVNYERFGDDVVGEKVRKEKEAALRKKKADAINNRVNR